jgi:hypothetical protein
MYRFFPLFVLHYEKGGKMNTNELHRIIEIKCNIEDGFIPTEKIAQIKTADGKTEEVVVFSKLIGSNNNTLPAMIVGETDKNTLIELPHETNSGKWRIWVKKEDLI